ncbi:MAG: fumarate reductase [Gammaproteobacteria bacterium RBG_16_51_14]|nr:MAG: fumarate reductase [Gammaproteobacteria bacterium RBG_16_51_14]
MKRSNEPVFWSLFGAGGVVAAFLLPMLIFITGIALPLGILPPEALAYDRIHSFASGWPGKLFLLAVISLPLWQSAHRIFLSLHDLGIHRGREFCRWLCYGTALLGTLIPLILLIRI